MNKGEKMKENKDLNKLNVEELQKEITKLKQKKEKVSKKKQGAWVIGDNYFIRTVTMIQVGKLIGITDNELILEDSAWVADTGRINKFLKGEFDSNVEIEPFPDGEVIIGRKAIIDCCKWKHNLLREVK